MTDKLPKTSRHLTSRRPEVVRDISSISAIDSCDPGFLPFKASAPIRHEPSAQTERVYGHIRADYDRMLPERNLGFSGDS